MSQYIEVFYSAEDVRFGAYHILEMESDSTDRIIKKVFSSKTPEEHHQLYSKLKTRVDQEHKNLINLLQIDEDEEMLTTKLFIEYSEGVFRIKNLNPEELINFISDALEGLSELELNGRFHGNLRPDFIGWFKNDNSFKIIDDFNSLSNEGNVHLQNIENFNPLFISSFIFESLIQEKIFKCFAGPKEDSFALGLIILEYFLEDQELQTIYDYNLQKFNQQHFEIILKKCSKKESNINLREIIRFASENLLKICLTERKTPSQSLDEFKKLRFFTGSNESNKFFFDNQQIDSQNLIISQEFQPNSGANHHFLTFYNPFEFMEAKNLDQIFPEEPKSDHKNEQFSSEKEKYDWIFEKIFMTPGETLELIKQNLINLKNEEYIKKSSMLDLENDPNKTEKKFDDFDKNSFTIDDIENENSLNYLQMSGFDLGKNLELEKLENKEIFEKISNLILNENQMEFLNSHRENLQSKGWTLKEFIQHVLKNKKENQVKDISTDCPILDLQKSESKKESTKSDSSSFHDSILIQNGDFSQKNVQFENIEISEVDMKTGLNDKNGENQIIKDEKQVFITIEKTDENTDFNDLNKICPVPSAFSPKAKMKDFSTVHIMSYSSKKSILGKDQIGNNFNILHENLYFTKKQNLFHYQSPYVSKTLKLTNNKKNISSAQSLKNELSWSKLEFRKNRKNDFNLPNAFSSVQNIVSKSCQYNKLQNMRLLFNQKANHVKNKVQSNFTKISVDFAKVESRNFQQMRFTQQAHSMSNFIASQKKVNSHFQHRFTALNINKPGSYRPQERNLLNLSKTKNNSIDKDNVIKTIEFSSIKKMFSRKKEESNVSIKDEQFDQITNKANDLRETQKYDDIYSKNYPLLKQSTVKSNRKFSAGNEIRSLKNVMLNSLKQKNDIVSIECQQTLVLKNNLKDKEKEKVARALVFNESPFYQNKFSTRSIYSPMKQFQASEKKNSVLLKLYQKMSQEKNKNSLISVFSEKIFSTILDQKKKKIIENNNQSNFLKSENKKTLINIYRKNSELTTMQNLSQVNSNEFNGKKQCLKKSNQKLNFDRNDKTFGKEYLSKSEVSSVLTIDYSQLNK